MKEKLYKIAPNFVQNLFVFLYNKKAYQIRYGGDYKNYRKEKKRNRNLPCDILKTIYSKFNFFIGTRFHSIIFSITSLVPSIAIAYGGNKAKGIMGDFNLDEYVVQIQDINPTQLCEMFNSLELNQLSVKEVLSNKMRLVTESRNRLIGDIKSLY